MCVCVWESVCLRSRAARFEMSGLDWFLLPLINSCYALMFCIENCWMAFSEIKTTNSAFHNLTGDWREADSWMIASLGDFFFFPKGELSTPSGFLFFFLHPCGLIQTLLLCLSLHLITLSLYLNTWTWTLCCLKWFKLPISKNSYTSISINVVIYHHWELGLCFKNHSY